MGRLTKAQRAKLVSPEDRARYEAMDNDMVLAIHDLMHEIMEQRFGTSSRSVAARAALEQEGGDG